MRTLEIGRSRADGLAVLVAPDRPRTIFRGIDTRLDGEEFYRRGRQHSRKAGIESPWIRLTGPAVDAAAPEDIRDGRSLDLWLGAAGRSGQLAIAEGVVVAFPSKPFYALPDNWPPEPSLAHEGWKFIPGPAESALREVPATRQTPALLPEAQVDLAL